MSTTLIIRDQYGIHPDDAEFVKEKVKEIVELLRRFRFVEMQASDQACLIGQALNELQPKIYKGQWENFCRDHFEKFRALSTLRRWKLMATFRPALLKHSRPELSDTTKSTSGASSTESKTYVALKAESALNANTAESTTYDEKQRSRVSATEPTTYASASNLPSIEASVKLIQGWMRQHRGKNRSTLKKSEPREYCPHCGQFLSKRVKSWMKQHSVKR